MDYVLGCHFFLTKALTHTGFTCSFFQLDDGLELSFTDKRRFAKVQLLDNVSDYTRPPCFVFFLFFLKQGHLMSF